MVLAPIHEGGRVGGTVLCVYCLVLRIISSSSLPAGADPFLLLNHSPLYIPYFCFFHLVVGTVVDSLS